MTRAQGWILTVLVAFTVVSYGWISRYSTGLHSYHWFQKQIEQQKKTNVSIRRENAQLRKEVTALRYDHRLIEREARDLLALTRKGEIVVHLPR